MSDRLGGLIPETPGSDSDREDAWMIDDLIYDVGMNDEDDMAHHLH